MSNITDRYISATIGIVITMKNAPSAKPVMALSAIMAGVVVMATRARTLAPHTSPIRMSRVKVLTQMSRNLPNAATSFAIIERSRSSRAAACVVERMLLAVMRSPVISSFCRADVAGGTENHIIR